MRRLDVRFTPMSKASGVFPGGRLLGKRMGRVFFGMALVLSMGLPTAMASQSSPRQNWFQWKMDGMGNGWS